MLSKKITHFIKNVFAKDGEKNESVSNDYNIENLNLHKLDDQSLDMVKGIFDLSKSTVKDFIVPRTDVAFLDVNTSKKELFEVLLRDSYSRYPVYESDIDNVIGILYIKDLLNHFINFDINFTKNKDGIILAFCNDVFLKTEVINKKFLEFYSEIKSFIPENSYAKLQDINYEKTGLVDMIDNMIEVAKDKQIASMQKFKTEVIDKVTGKVANKVAGNTIKNEVPQSIIDESSNESNNQSNIVDANQNDVIIDRLDDKIDNSKNNTEYGIEDNIRNSVANADSFEVAILPDNSNLQNNTASNLTNSNLTNSNLEDIMNIASDTLVDRVIARIVQETAYIDTYEKIDMKVSPDEKKEILRNIIFETHKEFLVLHGVNIDDVFTKILKGDFSFDDVKAMFENMVKSTISNLVNEHLTAYRGNSDVISIREILRTCIFIPEMVGINELLKEMKLKKIHLAITLDEWGGVSGIVSLEDIIEEIFGQIQDEFDDETDDILDISEEGSQSKMYLCNARTKLDDINEVLKISLPEHDFESLSGYVFHLFKRIPSEGEKVSDTNTGHSIDFIIKEIDNHKIKKVKIIVRDLKNEN